MAPVFSKADLNKFGMMFGMKWLWFVPNLVKIYSVFLRLLVIKQIGPGFWLIPCSCFWTL